MPSFEWVRVRRRGSKADRRCPACGKKFASITGARRHVLAEMVRLRTDRTMEEAEEFVRRAGCWTVDEEGNVAIGGEVFPPPEEEEAS